jgi:hypothetical protein
MCVDCRRSSCRLGLKTNKLAHALKVQCEHVLLVFPVRASKPCQTPSHHKRTQGECNRSTRLPLQIQGFKTKGEVNDKPNRQFTIRQNPRNANQTLPNSALPPCDPPLQLPNAPGHLSVVLTATLGAAVAAQHAQSHPAANDYEI